MGILKSWRPGPTREAIVKFLDRAERVPPGDRVAYFDNDGTLWCERPTYIQYDFCAAVLRQRVEADPTLAERPELAAVLSDDSSQVGELGIEAVAGALVELFAGMTPQKFTDAVQTFFQTATHRTLKRPLTTVVYQPMLEMLDELRRREFTIAIVTGGGTEFVRAISEQLYGVPADRVVGTLIGYSVERNGSGDLELRRTAAAIGQANEGTAKLANIQTQLGRAPLLAVGNSGGDREMLEWAASSPGGLAVLVDHDDAEREFAYTSTAATFAEEKPITTVAREAGWTVVSMASDWETIFSQ